MWENQQEQTEKRQRKAAGAGAGGGESSSYQTLQCLPKLAEAPGWHVPLNRQPNGQHTKCRNGPPCPGRSDTC